jgi:cell division septal protein FtsQ
VKFTFQEGLILASCEEIPLLIEKQTILFVLVLCLIALVLGVVVYCICEMAAMAPDYMSLRFIIVSGILSVFGVLFGAVLIFFSSEFFFIHQKVISDI